MGILLLLMEVPPPFHLRRDLMAGAWPILTTNDTRKYSRASYIPKIPLYRVVVLLIHTFERVHASCYRTRANS